MSDSAPKPGKASPPKAAATKPKATGKKPPADSKPPKESSGKPRGRPPELQKQLEETLMFVGLMTAGAVNEFDGEVIRENAASMAEAWNKVAQQNATVKRILNQMMETGAWSGAVAATAAVAIPIMQNHGAIPANIPHPFIKPPRVAVQQQAQQPFQPGMPTPPPGGVQVPPQQGSPIAPSRAAQPPEPPPGQHQHGNG